MDYNYNDVPESIDAELYRLRTKTRELEIEVDTLNGQNIRLNNEHSQMSHELNLRTKEAKTASSINAELRMMLFKAENERDELNNSLQSLKQKYNKLYDKYAVKDRTFKAINDSFREGNRMNPIGRTEHSRTKFQRPESILQKPPSQCDEITLELNRKLEEAYDKIEELEFDLESVEILENENEHLRNELNQFRDSTDSPLPVLKKNSRSSTTLITELQQQQFRSSSNCISETSVASSRSSTASSSSTGDNVRFSTTTTIRADDLNQNAKYKMLSENNNDNIYEPIGESHINMHIRPPVEYKNESDIVYSNESLSSLNKKPSIKSKPSFLRGARSSIGGEVKSLTSTETETMLSLVDELHQFKFKNSSQGPK